MRIPSILCGAGRLRLIYPKLYSLRIRLLALAILFVFLFYHLLPKLLRKTSWTYVGWHDSDFSETWAQKEIIILRWTTQWGEYDDVEILNSEEKCIYLDQPFLNTPKVPLTRFRAPCRITFDRRYLKTSHALVFHSFDLMKQEVPRERSKEQLWIYLQQECPIYTKLNLQAYPNVFNWTMTYRRDADVYAPYGQIVPMPKIVTDFNSSNSNPSITTTPPVALHKKTGLVAWIVSSCDSYSKREYLVKELQKYVTVDVYGWCGHDCPQNENCYSHVAKTHKFYLSFENSLCTDYITEKFFTAMKVDMIPVVYGGSRMQDYSSIAPHGSYIDAKSFNSVKDLAKYLIFLDKNDSDYLRYFDWKKKFKVIPGQGWCNVCQRVYEHLQASRKHNKWYKDMWKWWNYMGYDPSVEVDEHYDPLSASGQSYNYLLGEPACLSAHKNLTENPVHLDFEPGFLNGKIYGKLWSWARDLISQ